MEELKRYKRIGVSGRAFLSANRLQTNIQLKGNLQGFDMMKVRSRPIDQFLNMLQRLL